MMFINAQRPFYSTVLRVVPAGWMSSCTPAVWVPTWNTKVFRGIRVGTAASLFGCEVSCLARYNCSGFDWNPSSRARWRCFVHGPWTGPRVPCPAHGVTHYDIMRKCNGENSVDRMSLIVYMYISK